MNLNVFSIAHLSRAHISSSISITNDILMVDIFQGKAPGGQGRNVNRTNHLFYKLLDHGGT